MEGPDLTERPPPDVVTMRGSVLEVCGGTALLLLLLLLLFLITAWTPRTPGGVSAVPGDKPPQTLLGPRYETNTHSFFVDNAQIVIKKWYTFRKTNKNKITSQMFLRRIPVDSQDNVELLQRSNATSSVSFVCGRPCQVPASGQVWGLSSPTAGSSGRALGRPATTTTTNTEASSGFG